MNGDRIRSLHTAGPNSESDRNILLDLLGPAAVGSGSGRSKESDADQYGMEPVEGDGYGRDGPGRSGKVTVVSRFRRLFMVKPHSSVGIPLGELGSVRPRSGGVVACRGLTFGRSRIIISGRAESESDFKVGAPAKARPDKVGQRSAAGRVLAMKIRGQQNSHQRRHLSSADPARNANVSDEEKRMVALATAFLQQVCSLSATFSLRVSWMQVLSEDNISRKSLS